LPPAHSWQGDGKPKEAIEQCEWDVKGNFVKRYIRQLPFVAQKQGSCYILKTRLHQLKFRISAFAESSARNQKSEVCKGAK